MRLTVGMPSYNNFTEVFFTVQALRMYHNLTDCEILIVDNYGDPNIENFVKNQGCGVVRYEKYLDRKGTSCAKNRIFDLAKGEMVLCIDSHILLRPGSLDNIPVTDDLIHGPMVYNDLRLYGLDWKPVWRGNMWGIWGDCVDKLPEKPFEIWGMGGGCFAARKSSWLGFNDKFRGFGGEEGYIQEKYRKAGRKVICLPSLIWMHHFDRATPYRPALEDIIRNYLIGLDELHIDTTEMEKLYGEAMIKKVRSTIALESGISKPIKKISALCITYGRPHLLEEAIESFLRQDYVNKEMVIVNDLAEQELKFDHPQIKIFNFKDRFFTIGEKRNKAVELSTGDVLVTWDDDDICLPWRLSNLMNEFNSNPNLGYLIEDGAWFLNGDKLDLPKGIGYFYAYSRSTFEEVGGYRHVNCGEDADFDNRMKSHLNGRARTLKFDNSKYSYIYRWGNGAYHLSGFGFDKDGRPTGMKKVEERVKSNPIEPVVQLKPHWNMDYLAETRKFLV